MWNRRHVRSCIKNKRKVDQVLMLFCKDFSDSCKVTYQKQGESWPSLGAILQKTSQIHWLLLKRLLCRSTKYTSHKRKEKNQSRTNLLATAMTCVLTENTPDKFLLFITFQDNFWLIILHYYHHRRICYYAHGSSLLFWHGNEKYLSQTSLSYFELSWVALFQNWHSFAIFALAL